MRNLVLASVLPVMVAACKPAGEPPRRPTADVRASTGLDLGAPPSGTERVALAPATIEPPRGASNAPPVVGAVAFDRSEVAPAIDAIDSPEVAAPIEVAVVPEVVAEVVAAADDVVVDAGPDLATAAPFDGTLAPDLVAALERSAPADAQDQAKRLNKSGLEKHRKLQLDGAIADYQAALDAWPAHAYSRYNLACALALAKRDDEALAALTALQWVATHDGPQAKTAADRLRAARVDADFGALRGDPRFRAITRATDVLVAWSGEADRAEAERIAGALKTAQWLARVGARAWSTPVAATTIYVDADDPIARGAAGEIAIAATAPDQGAPPVSDVAASTLPRDAPPIVIVVGSGTLGGDTPPTDGGTVRDLPDAPDAGAAPAPADGPSGTAPKTLADFIGLRLFAGSGADRDTLELKPTGFFVWDSTRATGEHTKRTGRYRVEGTALSLDFKATIERPAPGAAGPAIEVREGQSETHVVVVAEPGVLTVDGMRFGVRPP